MDKVSDSRKSTTITNSKQSTLLLILGISLFVVAVTVAIFQLQAQQKIKASVSDAVVEIGAFPITIPTVKYGFALDTFNVVEDTIRSGDFLGSILAAHQVSYPDIQKLVENSKDIFKVSSLRVNRPYFVLSKEENEKADYFIYEPSVYNYYVFDLEELSVEKHERPIEYKSNTISGSIESSLWNAMGEQNASPSLFAKMEDALQWSIDFTRVQPGDDFKLVYDKEFIDDEEVGVGLVKAAYYKTGENEHFAIFHHTSDDKAGYYDLLGRPMNKGFLKSPVKSSRISSRYNLRRFHPIKKRVMPHYGTDYAAPYGTPIQAVGGGVVVRKGYTKGNGNFVKIKHDDTYQTQYLHMQGFAKGIQVGAQVIQGQTIGYVGSTGLATGPHVCFRFWKDSKQVNHLSLNFPPPAPLPDEDLPEFFKARDQYLLELGMTMPEGLEEEKKEETSIQKEDDAEQAEEPKS